MNLKDFYDKIGGDYEQVIFQLGDDEVIFEFLNKFFMNNQTDEIAELKKFLAEEKYEDAFRCVHNFKGYGLNMALTPFHEKASVLCEALRNGKPCVDINDMLMSFESTYNNIKTALQAVTI